MNEPIRTILCKKSFRQGGTQIYGEYLEGIYYTDFILETEELTRLHPIPYTYKYIYIKNESHGGIRFHLDKYNRENIIFPCFYDYFYDNQELRKLKLMKINGI